MKRWNRLSAIVVFLVVVAVGNAGCLNVLTQTTVSGSVLECGRPPAGDFPAGNVILCQNGEIIETAELGPGRSAWQFRCQPGVYEAVVTSRGRTRRAPVDTTQGSVLGLVLDFETVVIYGEVLLDGRPLSRTAGTVFLELQLEGTTVSATTLEEEYQFEFCVPPGLYTLRVNHGSSTAVFPISALQSCRRQIDLNRVCRIRGSVRERGAAPGTGWPGATVLIETDRGEMLERLTMQPGQESFSIPVSPGLYRAHIESGGREWVSGTLDLSQLPEISIQADFTQVVLHGEVRAEATTAPEASLHVLANGLPVKTAILNAGSTQYSVIVDPGVYDLEIAVPSSGGLIRMGADLSRSSRRLDIDLDQKVTITGQVLENNLIPAAGGFPAGGWVVFSTPDGVARKTGLLQADGSFTERLPAGIYSIEAHSEGRSTRVVKDATRGNQSAILNFTEVLLQGRLILRESQSPELFPASIVEIVSGGKVQKKIELPRGQNRFSVILSGGHYTVTVTLRDYPARATYALPDELKTSIQQNIDLSSQIARITGRVSTVLGTASGLVSVKLLRPGEETVLSAQTLDSSRQYEFYASNGRYDLRIDGSKYATRTYPGEYAQGDLHLDLQFTHCPITYHLTVKTGLIGFDPHRVRCLAAKEGYFENPVDSRRENVLQEWSLPSRGNSFDEVPWTITGQFALGQEVFWHVTEVNMGSVYRWKTVITEGATITKTVTVYFAQNYTEP